MGIVISPTAAQMADLIVKANSGAMKGLDLLRCPRKVGRVAAALVDIQSTLNEILPVEVKALFHGGAVEFFDVEHILCKVFRKQRVIKMDGAGVKRSSNNLEQSRISETRCKKRK